MNKKGQIEISFGMIFSIIIIIATIAVGAYVLYNFIHLSDCSKIGVFYNNLQKSIDKSWSAEISSDVFTGTLPSGITTLCFGNLSSSSNGYAEEYDFLRRYVNADKNVYLYPQQESCGSSLAVYKAQHLANLAFFCVPVSSGKVSFKIVKGNTEALPRITAK